MDDPLQVSEPAARPARMERVDPPGLRRIRALSHVLDQWIPLPGGMRIGLDPILGLIPWVGDLAMTMCSLFVVFEAARLGIQKRLLCRMLGNIAIESLAGIVPILGDLFDAAWKANVMNRRLVEQAWHPGLQRRSGVKVVASIGAVFGFVFLAFLSWIAFSVWVTAQLLDWIRMQF